MKRIVTTVVVAALMGAVGVARAERGEQGDEGRGRPSEQGMEGRRMMGPGNPENVGGGMFRRLVDNPQKAKEFGITEDQITALKASFADLEKKMVALRAEVETAEIDLRQVLDKDSPDEAAVMAAVEKVGQARMAIQKTVVQERLAVGKIVSPETMKKIRERVQERMQQSRGAGDEKGFRKDAPWKKGTMNGPQSGPKDE